MLLLEKGTAKDTKKHKSNEIIHSTFVQSQFFCLIIKFKTQTNSFSKIAAFCPQLNKLANNIGEGR